MKCPHLNIKCPNRETHRELKDNCLLKNPWNCPYQDKRDELLLTRKELDKIADESGKECLDFVDNAIKAQLAKAKQHYHPSIEAQKLQVELAKKQERERIAWQIRGIAGDESEPQKVIDKIYDNIVWQALQGLEEG